MTEQSTTSGTDDRFDPNRLRGISTMHRSRDDRMVAGVCAGAARYLRIDPVVLRVIIAALTIVGLAGMIIYVAAWLLLPEEGDERGLVDRYLPASVDREQFRRLGLFIAAAIAGVSAFGSGFAYDGGIVFTAFVALAVFYVFAVRPYNRRRAAAETSAPDENGEPGQLPEATDTLATTEPDSGSASPSDTVPQRKRNPRHDRGALFGLTIAVIVTVVGGIGLYEATTEDVAWPYYPLVALLITGVGMIVGGFVGNGRPLTLIGLALSAVLLTTTVLPTYTVGDWRRHPAYASDVNDSYQQGLGNISFDLSQISDPQQLDGRTVSFEQGLGNIEIVVPDDVNVDIDASTEAGTISLFGDVESGNPITRQYADTPSAEPELTLEIEQTAGQIEVLRQ